MVLSGVACTGPETNVQRLRPDLVVTTTSGVADAVAFEDVVVPFSAQQTFQVFNAGKADLDLTDIRIELDGEEVSDGIFSLDVTEGVVEPDEQITVTVSFAPDTFFAYDRSIVIESNDEEDPVYVLDLTGEGVDGPVPDISLSAESIDFGEVAIGFVGTEFVQILNVGDGPLDISSIDQAGSGAFQIAAGPEAGGTIAANSETSLIVNYVPTVDTGDSAVWTIYSNDPDEPAVELVLVGNGGSDEEYPVAEIDCPADGEVNPPVRIELDGRGSYDPEGRDP